MSSNRPRNATLLKIIGAYRTVAILLLNSLLFLLVINVGLSVLFAIKDSRRGPELSGPEKRYAAEDLAVVYPDFTAEERSLMLRENWLRPYNYADYVMFREAPVAGKYVNVSPEGIRTSANQGPWPPESANFNVFLFGGSTMFGYGLPDNQTFPTYLQEIMSPDLGRKVCVYNFGVGWYYSTQERILFERMIADGHQPDMVVFMDGLNECYRMGDRPQFSDRLRVAFDNLNSKEKSTMGQWMGQFALGRAVTSIKQRLGSSQNSAAAVSGELSDDHKGRIRELLVRYQRNIAMTEAICKKSGIMPIFIWQPIPAYKYDLKYHRFDPTGAHRNQIYGYAEFESVAKSGQLGSNFLWCADIQEKETEPLYVDNHHYTAKFSRKLAETVWEMCLERGLIDKNNSTTVSASSLPIPANE